MALPRLGDGMDLEPAAVEKGVLIVGFSAAQISFLV